MTYEHLRREFGYLDEEYSNSMDEIVLTHHMNFEPGSFGFCRECHWSTNEGHPAPYCNNKKEYLGNRIAGMNCWKEATK